MITAVNTDGGLINIEEKGAGGCVGNTPQKVSNV